MITPKGYVRNKYGVRFRFEHDVVWESHHGPIPKGMQVHHVDEDKTNNDISNLELLTPTEHKRIHGGCVRDEHGVWWKPCPVCGQSKPITGEHWYMSKEGWPMYNRCRPCHIRKVVEAKRERRARKKETAGVW